MGKRGRLEWPEFNTGPMTTRPKTSPARTPQPPARAEHSPTGHNPRPTQDQRWQRTVRFNWDKGGSRGGRK